MSQDKPVLSRESLAPYVQNAKDRIRLAADDVEYLNAAKHDLAVLELALSALERQGSGKWVPLEPTKDMVLAGQDEHDNCIDTGYASDAHGNRHDYTTISPDAPSRIYRAMLAASPTEPSHGQEPAPSAASGLADTLEKDLADTDDHNQPWYFKKHEMEQIIAALRSRQAPRGDRDSVIEECARLADAHKGSAAKAISVTRWKQMDEETRQEIRAEQRGEDIASEVIASAIRVLKTPPSPQTGGES